MTTEAPNPVYVQPKFHAVPSFYGRKQASVRLEGDLHDCEIEGIVPPELSGTLYGVGPDAQYPTHEEDIILNGDGKVNAWRIDDGHIDFKTRYVHTERYDAEYEARKKLFNMYRNPERDEPDAPQLDQRDNTGNTYAWYFNGRLFALREDSHPNEIDPITLETKEVFDFDGALKSTALSAHGKIDPDTGEWWAFGMHADRTWSGECNLIVADKNARLIREEQFQAPYPGMMHDFAVTKEHVIFDIQPFRVDEKRMKAGGQFYAFDQDQPSLWGIMPRDGSVDEIRWFRAPNVVCGHIMNAYTKGKTVIVDAPAAPGNSFPFFTDVDGNPTDIELGNATITRLIFDLAGESDQPKVVRVPGAVGEMPKIDDRFAMKEYKYGFFRGFGGLYRVNWETLEMNNYPMVAPDVLHEVTFVPREPDSPEGVGWLIAQWGNPATNRGGVVIFDAEHIEDGPIANAKIPFQTHMTFHGSFARDVV